MEVEKVSLGSTFIQILRWKLVSVRRRYAAQLFLVTKLFDVSAIAGHVWGAL